MAIETRLLSESNTFSFTATEWAKSAGILNPDGSLISIYPTVIGVADGSPDLDGFNIGIIANNRTVKGALQDLETAVSQRLVTTNNLSDLDDVPTARTNLGLGSSSTWPVGTSGASVPLMNTVNTWSGKQTFGGGASVTTTLDLTGASGSQTVVNILNGSSKRWSVYKNETVDSGVSTGSDFKIARFNNSGVKIDDPLSISRETGTVSLTQPLPILSGGTGVTSLSALKTSLNLNNVNNTSDANKPISNAVQTALTDITSKMIITFSTREEAILAIDPTDLAEGSIIAAGSLLFKKVSGATEIPDFLEMLPEGDVVVEHYGSGKIAIDAMKAHLGRVKISTGFTIDSNTTIDVPIVFGDGAYVTGAEGVTLTLSDYIYANPRQWIFKGDLNIVCTHVSGEGRGEAVREVEIGWWGAIPSGDTSVDYGPIFQKASSALGTVREGHINLLIGGYPIATGFSLYRGVHLRGKDIRMSVFRVLKDGFPVITLEGDISRISGVNFEWWGHNVGGLVEVAADFRVSPHILVTGSQCRVDDTLLSSSCAAIDVRGGNFQASRLRFAFAVPSVGGYPAWSSAILINASNVDIYDADAESSPNTGTDFFILIGKGASGSIASINIRNVRHISQSKTVGIVAENGNVGAISISDTRHAAYNGDPVGSMIYCEASNGSIVRDLSLSGLRCGGRVTKFGHFVRNTGSSIRSVCVENCISSGGGDTGLLLEESGTGGYSNWIVDDSCDFSDRSNVIISPKFNTMRISPGVLSNTSVPSVTYFSSVGVDTAVSLPILTTSFSGFITINCSSAFASADQPQGEYTIRSADPIQILPRTQIGTKAYSGVEMTGTYGSSGFVNMGITNNSISFENRTGGPLNITVLLGVSL